MVLTLVWGLPAAVWTSGVQDAGPSALQALALLLVVTISCLTFEWCDSRVMRRRIGQDRDEVDRFGGHICLYCRLQLPAEPPNGSCPECGQMYDVETNVRSWRWT